MRSTQGLYIDPAIKKFQNFNSPFVCVESELLITAQLVVLLNLLCVEDLNRV